MNTNLSKLGVGFIYKGQGRLERIIIYSGAVVDAIQFNYSDGSMFIVGGDGGEPLISEKAPLQILHSLDGIKFTCYFQDNAVI